MWQFFFFLIGFVFCSNRETDVETIAGVDVNLQCLAISRTDQSVTITWLRSNGTILFACKRTDSPCETDTTSHTLGRNDTFISSTVTIRDVSVVDEDEYEIIMLFSTNKHICKINLTVNVPPKGLIVVEENDATALQIQGSLTVAKGENKTLVCTTDISVKPSVDLEWEYPPGLTAVVEAQKVVNDEHNERLLVPTRRINFTLTYADDNEIVLICKVARNSYLDHIQTSIRIKNKGECTSKLSLETGSKESSTVSASNGDLKGSGSSYTTHVGTTDQGPTKKPWYNKNRLVLPGFSGLVMLLIVLAFVGCFIRSKKRNVRHSTNVESTEIRSLQGRRSLPPTPSDHLPDQPPPTARLLRPVPSIPSGNPMRPLVPVSEDAIRNPAERTGSRMPGETFTTTDGRTLVTQAKKVI